MRQYISAVCLVVLMSACSWGRPMTEAEDVALLASEAEARDCGRLGRTTVSLVDRNGGPDRDAEGMKNELVSLARISAARDLKANAILPVSGIVAGRQTFAVFSCPR